VPVNPRWAAVLERQGCLWSWEIKVPSLQETGNLAGSGVKPELPDITLMSFVSIGAMI